MNVPVTFAQGLFHDKTPSRGQKAARGSHIFGCLINMEGIVQSRSRLKTLQPYTGVVACKRLENNEYAIAYLLGDHRAPSVYVNRNA